MPDVLEPEEESDITDLYEFLTFVGSKRQKVWLGAVVNNWRAGIIAWTIGDRSSRDVSTVMDSRQMLAKFLVRVLLQVSRDD